MLRHHCKGMNLHEHQNYMVKEWPINSTYTSCRACFFSPAYVARTSGLEGIRPHSSNRSAPVGLCRWFHPLRSFPHRSHRCQSSGVPAKRLGRSMVQVFKRKHPTPTFPVPVHASFHLTIHLAGTQRDPTYVQRGDSPPVSSNLNNHCLGAFTLSKTLV